MNQADAFLTAIQEQPNDASLRLIFADWLEEQDHPAGELLRLTHTLTQTIDAPDRPALEARLRSLLTGGARSVGPFWSNPLGMKFVLIPPGVFLMGSPPDEIKESEDETQYRVTLTQGFWMSVHPVTQGHWQAVMGANPSGLRGETLPVEQVSWVDCQAFCERLSQQDGKRYRLPTEAEWEYACRGGTTTPFHFGETISPDQANYDARIIYGKGKEGVSRQQTTPVGSFPPNAWGLHDMHGNVWEWCNDFYGPYPASDMKDPQGDPSGYLRVLRGGSWFTNPEGCRSAFRTRNLPTRHYGDFGCRVCLSLD
jgi:uncharacterized protein (TIGR02996 family)